MTVLDCLKSLTLSAVGNDDRMLRKFANARGGDIINCQLLGPRYSSCIKCPGGGCSRPAFADMSIYERA